MDQSGVAALEKAIVQGRPVIIRGVKDKLNQLAMPLLYHYSTLTEHHISKGNEQPHLFTYLYLNKSMSECFCSQQTVFAP